MSSGGSSRNLKVAREYWLVTTGDDKEPGINGGLTRPREGQTPGTLNTIAVSSLDQTMRKLSSVAERFAYPKWRFRKWAGSLTRKIQRATCSELSSQTQMPVD